MKVACVDVGNSNSRLALVDDEGVRLRIKFPTAGIGGSDCVLVLRLRNGSQKSIHGSMAWRFVPLFRPSYHDS